MEAFRGQGVGVAAAVVVIAAVVAEIGRDIDCAAGDAAAAAVVGDCSTAEEASDGTGAAGAGFAAAPAGGGGAADCVAGNTAGGTAGGQLGVHASSRAATFPEPSDAGRWACRISDLQDGGAMTKMRRWTGMGDGRDGEALFCLLGCLRRALKAMCGEESVGGGSGRAVVASKVRAVSQPTHAASLAGGRSPPHSVRAFI